MTRDIRALDDLALIAMHCRALAFGWPASQLETELKRRGLYEGVCEHDWRTVGLDSWACKKCFATKTAIV